MPRMDVDVTPLKRCGCDCCELMLVQKDGKSLCMSTHVLLYWIVLAYLPALYPKYDVEIC